MLDTEEVDDDYFTPVASTSLANIFGNVSKNPEITENDSLKYVPPKPKDTVPKKKEPAKATECVFACAVIGHEWCQNVYTSRGKLGFAIFKIQKTGEHNIVLYDSSKTTLSSTVISTKLEVTIKNNSYISYYDSLHKYWSIYGTDDETKRIADLLKGLGTIVTYSTYTDKELLQPSKSQIAANATVQESVQENRESDTDSSINRKTKASILNRMAHMGHSVLPVRALLAERTSDSSDTNDFETQPKPVRHKTLKSTIKRNNIENIVSEPQLISDSQQTIIVSKTEPDHNFAVYNNSQLIPLNNANVIANTSTEFNMFMSEQRISNSELRINLNRIQDKVDSVLNKIQGLEHKDQHTDIPTNILLKLLAEYENKIKIYEELFKSRGIDKINIEERLIHSSRDKDLGILQNKIFEIEKVNEDRNNEISNLQKEIELLKEKHAQENFNQNSKENELLTKINSLENNLKAKEQELEDVTNSDNNIGDKVKNIMNTTFQTISLHFDKSEVYTGETVKRIIGTVIKKITISTLDELKEN